MKRTKGVRSEYPFSERGSVEALKEKTRDRHFIKSTIQMRCMLQAHGSVNILLVLNRGRLVCRDIGTNKI